MVQAGRPAGFSPPWTAAQGQSTEQTKIYKEADMATSHDKVILTADERRVLAALEEAAGHNDLRRRLSLTVAARAARLRSPRSSASRSVLLFVAGVALMVATFTRWPAVAVVGVAAQATALWWGLTLLAPRMGAWVAPNTGRSATDHDTTPTR
jgi:hypothetical protein